MSNIWADWAGKWPSRSLKLSALWLVVMAAAVPQFSHAHFDAANCEARLKVSYQTLHGAYIKANGVAVTGEFLYPLEAVLTNLDLKEGEVAARYKGKNTLTVGEGLSGFFPFLLAKGVSARALDLWYHKDDFPANFSGDLMRQYITTHGDLLVQGDARKMPIPDESMDAVFSHMLVNNVNLLKQKAIVRDMIRVLKAGGEARISGFDDAEAELIGAFLDSSFKGLITFEFKKTSFELDYPGSGKIENSNLLLINKLPL